MVIWKKKRMVDVRELQKRGLVPKNPDFEPENVERSLAEIRRAKFSAAVMGARQKAVSKPPRQEDILDNIQKSRKSRGIK